MTDPETIDGTVAEERRHTELEPLPPRASVSVAPQVSPVELVARLEAIQQAQAKAMTRDVDYGVIPGTKGRPTLLKPGAEKLGALFQLDVQLTNDKTWGPGDHLTVVSHALVYHQPTGVRLGSGEGLCSTRESKYAYRKQERQCTSCGQPAVIQGKPEYGGGWVCFKKRGGCGAKFQAGDGQIEAQQVGMVDNPDLPDLYNTVVKMAEKRARVDATLAVTGASAVFTQDAEDTIPSAPAPDLLPEAGRERFVGALKSLTGATGEDREAIVELWRFLRGEHPSPSMAIAQAVYALEAQRAAFAAREVRS